MKALYIALAVLSLPATLILSNLFWTGFREARAIGMILGSPEFLQRFVTADVLTRPPADVVRFAQPLSGGYAVNMKVFREADRIAHSRGRSILRPALAVVVLGSGVVGFLGVGWLGVLVPVVNLLIAHQTFMRSTQGAIDKETSARAVEHVQITAVILSRWNATNPREAATWLEAEPRMKPLSAHLAALPVAARRL